MHIYIIQGWVSRLTMTFTGKFVCIAHHFILPRLNCFDRSVDREGWLFEHSVSLYYSCGFHYQQRVLKTFPGSGCLSSITYGELF